KYYKYPVKYDFGGTKANGKRDVFEQKPVHRKVVSTRQDPNIAYTSFQERKIFCSCERGDLYLNITPMNAEETKRCECGHWFKLVVKDLPYYE
ncbi:hypothetical protein A3Q56_06877, partial [Intoshia linei]